MSRPIYLTVIALALASCASAQVRQPDEILGIAPGSTAQEVRHALAAADCHPEEDYEGPHDKLGRLLPVLVLTARGCRTHPGLRSGRVQVFLHEGRTYQVRIAFSAEPNLRAFEKVLGDSAFVGPHESYWYDMARDIDRRLDTVDPTGWKYEMTDFNIWVRIGVMRPVDLAWHRGMAKKIVSAGKETAARRRKACEAAQQRTPTEHTVPTSPQEDTRETP